MKTARSSWVLGARSETGFVRAANEDRMCWVRAPYGDVFVVSDGMGGYRGGALAAQITVETLQRELAAIPPDSDRFTDHVRQAFITANREVFSQRRADDPETRDMGATGVALVIAGARFIVAHVGDSRAYLWRRGRLRQLTRDHTYVQRMVDGGLLTPEQAASHPEGNVLERAIGHEVSVQVDVTDWIALEAGDLLLLCSDGLCGYVEDAEIVAILAAGADPQPATDRLIGAALAHGGHDNVTVQLIHFTPPRRMALARTLSRPIFLAPACVAATGAVALAIVIPRAQADRMQIQALTNRLNASLATAPRPASAESAAKPLVVARATPASTPSSAAFESVGPAPSPVGRGSQRDAVSPVVAARSSPAALQAAGGSTEQGAPRSVHLVRSAALGDRSATAQADRAAPDPHRSPPGPQASAAVSRAASPASDPASASGPFHPASASGSSAAPAARAD